MKLSAIFVFCAILVTSILARPSLAGECGHPRFVDCPSNMVVYQCDSGKGPESIVNYPTPTAVNDCGPVQVFLRSGPDSGTSLPPGTYDVAWETVEDKDGHVAFCSFQIRVQWRPTIICPRDTLVRACGPFGANVDYPLPTAFDDCGPIPVGLDEGLHPGEFFPIGLTRVTYRTNEDAHGSLEECSFYVRVEWPRTIICPEDTTITICPGQTGINVDYTVQAFDDCGPIPVELVDGSPPGGFFAVGTTPVIFDTEEDRDGHFEQCSFLVRVRAEDHEPPVLTCPEVVNAALPPGQSSVPVTFEVKATDDCGGTVTVECTPPSGSLFPCGETTVSCTAVDASQNQSYCTFTVNVGIPVSLDVRPGACPNPFKISEQGVVPVAIHGSRDFDVSQIDPASLRLEGVAPLRWTLEDVGAPYLPYVGKDDCLDCATTRKDRIGDLALKFDATTLGDALGEVTNGECRVIHLAGALKNGCPIVGEDVLKLLAPLGAEVVLAERTPDVVPSALIASHPNPFRSGNRIEYALPMAGRTRLAVYDVLGRQLRVLLDEKLSAGHHSMAWDGTDRTGTRMPGGLYFYVLTVDAVDGSGTMTRKKKLVLTP